MKKALLEMSIMALIAASGVTADVAIAASNPPATSAVLATGLNVTANDAVASRIIGAPVYDGGAQSAHQIGTIDDLILDPSGNVSAAIVGVGGFLGVGQKDVAVKYSKLNWTTATDKTNRLTLDVTKEALNSAPAFTYPSDLRPAGNNAMLNPALTTGTKGTGSDAPSKVATANSAGINVEVDPTNLKPIALDTMKSDDLKGTDVISPKGVNLGSVGDFVLTKDGKVDSVIVDFGGFLGIGTKQVAIAYDGLKFMSDQNNKRYLEVNVTKDQLNAQTTYNKNTYPADRLQQRMTVNS